jgi:hypothetical protein
MEQRMAGNALELGLVTGIIPDRIGTSGDRLPEHFKRHVILSNDNLWQIHPALLSSVKA